MKIIWVGLAMILAGIVGAATNGASVARKCTTQNEFSYAGKVYLCAPLLPVDTEEPAEPAKRRPVSI